MPYQLNSCASINLSGREGAPGPQGLTGNTGSRGPPGDTGIYSYYQLNVTINA